jgi:membrane protein
MGALSETWKLLRDTVLSFIDDEALGRGAAISFYTVTSVAPVLLIVIAIAGLAFGRDAAQNALTAQLSGLMGQQSAEILQSAVASAAGKSSGILATIVGIITLFATASGVFGEMQSALNAIWKVHPTLPYRDLSVRAASLGLVAALGFFLMVSLVVSAALTAFGNQINSILPFGRLLLSGLNFAISSLLISILFAAIYKVLPDRHLEWRDVAVGAVVTAVLFTIGKSLIGLYIGSSAVASSYGAAGALIVLLLWVSPLKYFCWARNSLRFTRIGMAASKGSLSQIWERVHTARRDCQASPNRWRVLEPRPGARQSGGAPASRCLGSTIILHELTTNAAKYGASIPERSVRVFDATRQAYLSPQG